MEHLHKEDFCLTCTLTKITPLLPRQGPIKDFIHQNMLQVFIDKPFHDALGIAAGLYGAKQYMDLGFYRKKFKNNEISEASLVDAIEDQFGSLNELEFLAVRHAMFDFFEIVDEKTLHFLARREGLSQSLAEVQERAQHCDDHILAHRDLLRGLLNDRLGCQIDHEVNPILFRLLGSYVDQGVVLWPLLEEYNDFRTAVLTLANNGTLPLASFVDNHDFATYLKAPIEVSVERLLANIFSSADLYADYVKESLFHHPGWSGMINVVANNPDSLAKRRNITVAEMLVVKLALEWQFIKHKAADFQTISSEDRDTARLKALEVVNERVLSLTYWMLCCPQVQRISDDLIKKIGVIKLQRTWHIAYEKQYYRQVAEQFSGNVLSSVRQKEPKSFQVIFCLDDRECSFRRHLEAEDSNIETFGCPGFFGIEFYFKPHEKDLLEKMCPVPVTPKYLVMEQSLPAQGNRKERKLLEYVSFISRHGANSMFFGFVSAYTLGHLSAFRLLFSFFQPAILLTSKLSSQEEETSLLFERDPKQSMHKGLFLGFTREEMADRIFAILTNMSLVGGFAPVVFAIGHGSSSVNNPHFAAYDCAACSQRPGEINARLFAAMANIKEVRELVAKKGIYIPEQTIFVGGIHDTCTDEVKFFDLGKLSKEKLSLVSQFLRHLTVAQAKNAVERCKRFALVAPNISPERALKEVRHRSRALFEPRPELGHATNALCVVGRRARTYHINFNRRAFLQSYDPTKDESGQILASIMSAVIPVCGGVNLDYYFSRIDPAIYGCGTKLSHNVCSLIGVGNGLDDDLRTGLPIQMTELHEPIRLLIVIEQTPEIIVKSFFSNPTLMPWVANDWLKIASLDPDSNHLSFYDAKRGNFSSIRTAMGLV